TCPAPSFGTRWLTPDFLPPAFAPSRSSFARLIFCLRSDWSFSVPLCLGSRRNISRSFSSRSAGVVALRNSSSALLYCGGRLGGIDDAPSVPLTHPGPFGGG